MRVWWKLEPRNGRNPKNGMPNGPGGRGRSEDFVKYNFASINMIINMRHNLTVGNTETRYKTRSFILILIEKLAWIVKKLVWTFHIYQQVNDDDPGPSTIHLESCICFYICSVKNTQISLWQNIDHLYLPTNISGGLAVYLVGLHTTLE
mgnify:CR=1 FL=1